MNNKNYCEYCGEESAVLFKYKTYIENIEHLKQENQQTIQVRFLI